MLTKKRRFSAMALVLAMLFTSVNPVTAHAEETMLISTHNHGTLIVTADLMDDKGVVTLENLNWDKIVIPNDLGAKKVVMKNVIAAEVVMESGTSCEVEISGGTIAKLEVTASEEEDMDLRDMAKLIADGMSKTKAQEEYQKNKKAQKEEKAKAPVITLKDKAEVGTITVAGNASLSLKDGKVDKLAVVSGNAENLKVTVDGFNGSLSVEQNGKKFGTVALELKNSKPAKAEIIGNGKGSIVLNGEASVIAEAVVNDSASVVLAVETKKLETAKDSKDVELVVLASVEEVVVNGEATDVNVTSGAVVKKAVINGANATVEGKGKVEKAAVSSDTAKVETKDTEVYDPATATATPAPTAKPTAKPTSKPSSGGSGGSGGGSTGGGGGLPDHWYPTYIPKPTKVPVVPTATPTEAPVMTATPTPAEKPEGTPTPTPHVHKWNVEAATCVTPKKCTDESCGFVAEDATGIHIFSEEGVVTKPTCTEAGYTTYKCLYCDESKQDSIVGSTGHTVTEWTIGELVENETCLYTQVGTCTTCGEKVTSETNVEKHSEELGTGVEEATCKVVGYKKYYCLDCGKTLKKEDYSNPEAHKWVDNGDNTYTCEYCDATKTVVAMTEAGLDANDLDKNTEVELSKGVSITLDDAVLTQVQTASGSAVTSTGGALKLSADVLSGEKKATAVGGLNDVALKEQIGDSDIYDFNMLVGEDRVSDFDGKVTVRIPYTLADGEDPDGIIVWYLTDDGEVESITGTYYNGYVTFKTNHFSYYTVVRMTPEQRCKLYGHIMLSATTNPTCTEDGYVTSICQRCAATEVTPGEKATGHNIVVEVIEEATCQHKGKHRHECNNKHCEFYTEVETPKGNHKPTKETGNKKEATCTEAGYIEYKCDDDKCEYHKKEEIKAKGHKQGKDGKCKNCGIDMTCEHKATITLVTLAENATTCLDGVVCTKYCLQCESVVEEKTVKDEHHSGVVNYINLYTYGDNCPGYIYEWGCACGEVDSIFLRSNEVYEGYGDWVISSQQYTDDAGRTHQKTIWTSVSCNVRVEADDCALFRVECDETTERLFRVYVNEKLVGELGGTMIAESHFFGYKATLLEGSKTCEDGVQVTEFCLRCDKEFFTWTNKWCTPSVIKFFELDDYSENSCGGFLVYRKCPCGLNENIFTYYGTNSCSLKSSSTTSTRDENGEIVYTTRRACDTCGFVTTDTYYLEQLEGCTARRTGTVSIYVNGEVAENYEYSIVQNQHNTYTVVELANEGSKSCLDGVNFENYCYDCGEKVGWGSTKSHRMGEDKKIDLSEYEDTCGGVIRFRSCACGENRGIDTAEKLHNMVYNTSSKTDENGMEYWEQTVRCRDCEYNYILKYTIAEGENCTAVQSNEYAFYVGDVLLDTYAYSYNREYHDTYYSEAVLMEGSTTCEDGVMVTQKCRNCDYTWTSERTGHTRVEKEVIDLADYGSACGGHIYVQECACGQNSNTTADLECDYGYSWDYIRWNNYMYIGEENGVTIERAEYQCSVTDPTCGFKFAMERQIQPAVGCRRDGITYFCIDKDNDGVYETKFPVFSFWRTAHDVNSAEEEVEYTTENDVALKVVTKHCVKCNEYVDIKTYADYLGDESYCYMIESAWGTEGYMEYETWEYTFDEDCCSYTRIRSNDNGKYEVLETRPGCMADEVLSWATCTQYATGVCKKCGNENALNLRNYGSPRKHNFEYNSETGMYECSRCGLENEKGANGTITLEDMSDEANYIAGYWNGGEPWGVNELVYSVFVVLHTEAEDFWTELEVTDVKCFDTGKVSISKEAVAAWAAAKGVTDYDVMFSFIPKNASVDTAFNITFTEEVTE